MLVRLIDGLIRIYQLTISPVLGPSCRFTPTCSEYARDAVKTHGALKGTGLALRRLSRCRPGHPGGYDPVPPLH
ncbi:MAG: membrane protein insertion efficiency factor YidD [Burkholderiales bacterium]